MSGAAIDVETGTDDAITIQLHGTLDAEDTASLRRTLVHAVRRRRPRQLVVDLQDLRSLDAITLGAIAAACQLGEDHHVAVFVDHCTATVADLLGVAGVPRSRLRHIAPTTGTGIGGAHHG